MFIDVVDLREFYATPLGGAAQASLVAAINELTENSKDCVMVGLGYPLPIFEKLNEEKERALVLMPARQGALQWPSGKSSRCALVDEDELPLANASVDCLMLVHLLENVADPAATLNEAWRVLAPEGRLVIIATNRRGIWARFEHTPFGTGRPFSKSQLGGLLRMAKLTPIKWQDALHFPPLRGQRLIRFHRIFEKIAKKLWPIFSGVIVVEATKRLYQGVPAGKQKARRVLVPALSPQGSQVTSNSKKYSGN